ncbi:enamine deaminase RidA (YjgF/YER057c/UK114 family) [Allocatelliglobosispora scoriae]|uniref:Enamine deaminase RidA (YjgF/YER057c/UK114 family) n=1 Tax=Allocatelliglobosispora scoriae TaxID=643052 RepID=A0A841C0U9_9ACTN|nr:RidA family protein [Allocatelliglobosispora scoriae]MBB5873368.1 enamine deaminase RidA (YjgF/YER057c/UK114 family) [Allocatelliglobosispora scoriae]
MTIHLPATGGHPAATALLGEWGLEPGDLVHLAEYVTPHADPVQLAAGRNRLLHGHVVPVSTIPVRGFPDDSGDAFRVVMTADPGGSVLRGSGRDVLRSADGIVYLPSVHTAEGEFRDQYRWCLERLEALLGGLGLGLDALVLTTDYTATATRADYPRCGRPRRDLLGDGPVHPGAAGILVDHPVAPGAMVSLDAVAATGSLRAVNPGWARYDTLTYKPAVVAGRHVFGAGFGALDPVTQTALHDGDLLAQAAYIYDSIDTVLDAAGGAEVVTLLEYVTPAGVTAYPELAALRAARFPRAAVTSVVCDGLLRPEFLLEVIPRAVLR